jgi:hypothetical protein
MKNRYRLFRRGRVFYAREVETGKNESLKTTERSVAERLLHAKNEASRQPQVNLAMARAYLAATDPLMSHRTWSEVMEEYRRTGKEATQERVERAFTSAPFALIKDKKLIETNSSDLLRVLHAGGTSTNNYLRGIHNHGRGIQGSAGASHFEGSEHGVGVTEWWQPAVMWAGHLRGRRPHDARSRRQRAFFCCSILPSHQVAVASSAMRGLRVRGRATVS